MPSSASSCRLCFDLLLDGASSAIIHDFLKQVHLHQDVGAVNL